MRKSIYILPAIFMAGMLFFVLSCSKEEIKSKKQNQPVQTPYEQQVTQAIKDFKQKVAFKRENPEYKSGETVSVDSAMWLLEATINYSHGFPSEYYDELLTEELTLVVPKNGNGEVNMDVLTSKYEQMKSDITTVYNNSTFENKGLVLVDLSEASQTSDEITFDVETVTGDRGGEPPPPVGDGPFEEGDDWWYGESIGHCYEPYVLLDDAANQLYQEAMDLIPDPNGNYYFINEFTFTIDGGQEYFQRDQTPDNYLDYWLYYAIEGEQGIPFDEEEVLCVEYPEMNAYYHYLSGLMFVVLPDDYLPDEYHLFGYTVESFVSLEDQKVNINPFKTEYFHKARFTYGIKVGYDEGVGPEEL